MVELFIEGIKADFAEDISADITYSLADIRTPEKRQVNYSKTITLNGTAKIDALFGFIYDVDVSNPDNDPALPNVNINYTPKKLAKAQLYVNRIQIFDGTLRLWKIIKKGTVKSYEVSLFGKLFDVFSEIGDGSLKDLDYSDLNHSVTWSNIQSNWSASGVAYRYPLIDTGVNVQDEDGLPSTFKFGSLLPCMYHKVFLDKIFSSVGGTFTLNFSDTTLYDKIIVTPPNAKLTANPAFFKAHSDTGGGYTFGTYSHIHALATVDEIEAMLSYDTTTNKLTFVNDLETSLYFKLHAKGLWVGDPDAALSGGLTLASFKANLYSSGGSLLRVLSTSSFHVDLSNSENEIIIEVPKQIFNAGEVLSLSLQVKVDCEVTLLNGYAQAISPSDRTEYAISDGFIYDMSLSAPELKQVDFIRDFIRIFNLYVTPNPEDPKNLIFTPHVDFYSRLKSNAVDWTYKVDHNEPIEITPISQLTAKEYILTWKADKDFWNDQYTKSFEEVYGQMRIISNTDIVSNKEKIESVFSPAIMVRYNGSQVVCPAIYKVEIVDNVQVRKPDKFNSRLLLWGGLLDSGHDIDLLTSTGSVSTTITQYPYAGHIDNPITPTYDINFGNTYNDLPQTSNNLYNLYWFKSIFEAFNKDGKLIQCTMLIRPEDIENLDFAALYKVGHQFYRLNKIEGFNPFLLSTCKVELIKVVTL